MAPTRHPRHAETDPAVAAGHHCDAAGEIELRLRSSARHVQVVDPLRSLVKDLALHARIETAEGVLYVLLHAGVQARRMRVRGDETRRATPGLRDQHAGIIL